MKAATIVQIYQIKISLMVLKPLIWRRVLVPSNFSFHEFHLSIQDAMGWENDHLYGFKIPTKGKVAAKASYFRTPGVIIDDSTEIDPELILVEKFFNTPKQEILYMYDFGDDWLHKIVLEEILEPVSKQKYPICIEGEKACPPEDCGGIYGYANLLNVIKNPDDPEYEDMVDWLGEDFDPEDFDPKKVKFYFQKKMK